MAYKKAEKGDGKVETISETSQSKELKAWQKGFELDYLKDLEKRFTSYNEYAQHEMSKFKKIILQTHYLKMNCTC